MLSCKRSTPPLRRSERGAALTTVGAVGDEPLRPDPSASVSFIAPLQRVIAGVLLMSVFTVRIDWFSTGVIGAAILVWAALSARSACDATPARIRWVAVSAAAATAAVWGLLAPKTQNGALFVQVVNAAVVGVLVWAMAATVSGLLLPSAHRWRRLSVLVWPAVGAFGAVAVLVAVADSAGDGTTGRLGDLEATMPWWAWTIAAVGLVPLVVAIVILVRSFVATYREVAATARG